MRRAPATAARCAPPGRQTPGVSGAARAGDQHADRRGRDARGSPSKTAVGDALRTPARRDPLPVRIGGPDLDLATGLPPLLARLDSRLEKDVFTLLAFRRSPPEIAGSLDISLGVVAQVTDAIKRKLCGT